MRSALTRAKSPADWQGLCTRSTVFTPAILRDLRLLNELQAEARLLPAASLRRRLMLNRAHELLQRLPVAVRRHHARFAAQRQLSIQRAAGNQCPACGAALPESCLDQLDGAEGFSACPSCQMLLWAGKGNDSEGLFVSSIHRGRFRRSCA